MFLLINYAYLFNCSMISSINTFKTTMELLTARAEYQA